MKDDNTKGIMFDADSYFFPLLFDERIQEYPVDYSILYPEDSSVRDLRDLNYFEARSVCVPYGAIDDTIATHFMKFRQACHSLAGIVANQYILKKHPILPLWLETAMDQIVDALADDYPNIRFVEPNITMEPRFNARAITHNKVHVSALSRTFLRHFNLVVWNIIDTECKYGTGLFDPPDTRLVARLFVPYLVYLHDMVPITRLPFLGVNRAGLFGVVLNTTKLQMQFILLHEFAHILLGHIGKKNLSIQEKEKFEIEADRFAFRGLVKIVQKDDSTSIGDLWMAIRWLHQFQIIRQVVHKLLNEETVILDDLSFDKRKNEMYALLPQKDLSEEDNLFEMRGTLILQLFKRMLIDLGPNFLQRVVQELISETPSKDKNWWNEVPDQIIPELTFFKPKKDKSNAE